MSGLVNIRLKQEGNLRESSRVPTTVPRMLKCISSLEYDRLELDWELRGFRTVLKMRSPDNKFAEELRLPFKSGVEMGVPTNWELYFYVDKKDALGVMLRLRERGSRGEKRAVVRYSFQILKADGSFLVKKGPLTQLYESYTNLPWGDAFGYGSLVPVAWVLDPTSGILTPEGALKVKIQFTHYVHEVRMMDAESYAEEDKIRGPIEDAAATAKKLVEVVVDKIGMEYNTEVTTNGRRHSIGDSISTVEGGPGRWSRHFLKLLESGEFADYKILLQEEEGLREFRAHKVILAGGSHYFRERFESDVTENVVTLEDISSQVMGIVLRVIYSGMLLEELQEVRKELYPELLSAASKFELTGMKDWLDCRLVQAATRSNAGMLLHLALLHGLRIASQDIKQFISKHASNENNDNVTNGRGTD